MFYKARRTLARAVIAATQSCTFLCLLTVLTIEASHELTALEVDTSGLDSSRDLGLDPLDAVTLHGSGGYIGFPQLRIGLYGVGGSTETGIDFGVCAVVGAAVTGLTLRVVKRLRSSE